MELSQSEADLLIATPKWFADNTTINLEPGKNEVYELQSGDPREGFLFDARRGRIKLAKVRYQERVRTSIVLVRLDLDGAPHTNPDGQVIACPHIHVYKEGYGTKWAEGLDPEMFSNPSDVATALTDFCGFCNITNIPLLQDLML